MTSYLVLAGAGMTVVILFMAIATMVVARVRRPRTSFALWVRINSGKRNQCS